MSWIMFIISVTIYVLFLGFIMYICVLADPDESKITKYMTETMPVQLWNFLEKYTSKTFVHGIELFLDKGLLLMYFVVTYGSWCIIFVYIYPWIHKQTYLPLYHKYIGYLVFLSAILSWRYASTTKPGIITSQTIQQYEHDYVYDQLMYIPNQICRTRHIPRLARSKFDRLKYQENVARFDHYCGWVNNTIGGENYRWFLLFLFVHVTMCWYGSYCVGTLFYGVILDKDLLHITFFDRNTGEEIHATKWIVFQYMFSKYLTEMSIFIIMTVMGFALTLFLLYHCWLTSKNLTTNESYKWDQIMKWYKHELKRYNEYNAVRVRKGPVKEEEEDTTSGRVGTTRTTNPATSIGDDTDQDVTCTGTSRRASATTPASNNTKDDENEVDDNDVVQHPGPPPVNIYNRGFVENWKEVIFPLSLRRQQAKSNNKPKLT